MIPTESAQKFLVKPGAPLFLKDQDPDWEGNTELRNWDLQTDPQQQKVAIDDLQSELAELQEQLFADDRFSVLVILHGLAGADLDGIVRRVFSGVNPQGCSVSQFKKPSSEELDHNFLWRYYRALPERGRIGVFKGSYYDEVVGLRFKPDLIAKQKLTPRQQVLLKEGESFWSERLREISEFEMHLTNNGTRIVKVFVDISKEEQRRRFLAWLDDPAERWKFTASDLAERANWDALEAAWEQTISQTSPSWAPWYVLPGNHAWTAQALATAILAGALTELGVSYPKVSPEVLVKYKEAEKQLEEGRI